MKKIILAPDSFKGTISSTRICDIMESVIKKHHNDIQIVKIPIADGGEGTVESFLQAMGGRKINISVQGPYFENIYSLYAIMPDEKTAVIEMASVAGLPLVEGKMNPALTTTFGVGELIKDAINKGCTKIIVGLGGSATNDGGTGMASALGINFFDKNNHKFIPIGGTLNNISRIDISGKLKELEQCDIIAMCDVNNPLYGKNGAAYVFAPQKGADENMVINLDENLKYLSNLIKNNLGIDLSKVPGSGAAGGLGAGLVAFIGAKIKSGIETILDIVGFNKLLDGADLVLTGEGKIDNQSVSGKAVIGIAKRAKLKNVPVIAVVGDIGDNIDVVYQEGITAIISINRTAIPFETARMRSESDLALTIDSLMRILNLASNDKQLKSSF
jgi:glycerate kinase